MKKYFIPLFIILFLASCVSPKPIAKLKVADNKEVIWKFGSEVVNLKFEDLYLEVGFLECWNDYWVFFVTVQNNSKYPFLVDPSRFYYKVDSLFNQNSIVYNKIVSTDAVDPEVHLNFIDANISRTVADRKNALISHIATEAIVTAAEIAVESSINNDENREKREIERDIRRAERYNSYIENNINREIYFNNLEAERAYWANKSLRKTTLAPGYEIGGLVFFNRNDFVSKMTMNFKVENIDYKVTYYQTLIKP